MATPCVTVKNEQHSQCEPAWYLTKVQMRFIICNHMIHDVSVMLKTVTQQSMEKQNMDSGLDVNADKNGYSRTKLGPHGQWCSW